MTGARFTPTGDYDLSQPPRAPPTAELPLVQKYMAIQDRVVSDEKAVVERARSRQYTLASESTEGTRVGGRGSGCMVLVVIGLATVVYAIACAR